MKIIEIRMRVIMQMKKMRSADLVKLLGMSKNHFSNVLKCRRQISIRHTKMLIEYFGAEVMARMINWNGMGFQNLLAVKYESNY